MTNRKFPIIGVIGKTNVEKVETNPLEVKKFLNIAEMIGALIVGRGCAVLTGGHHRYPEYSVKYHALKGVVDTKNVKFSLLIGIVPKKISDELKYASTKLTDTNHKKIPYYLYSLTQLKNKERDEITGQVADVYIAMYGTGGTEQEVAAAIKNSRKVIYLPSNLDHLAIKQNKIRDMIMNMNSSCVAIDPIDAVNKALHVIKDKQGNYVLEGNYPSKLANPDKPNIIKLKTEFDKELAKF